MSYVYSRDYLESHNVLVTALENGSDTVPALETVTESLLREQKLKDREEVDDGKKLLVAKGKKQVICHLILQEAWTVQERLF